jgi:transposase
MMRQEILGTERRRQWTDAQKHKIIEEIGVDGASVAEVARRHDLTRQHLYQWRNHFRRKRALADDGSISFLPVEMKPIEKSPSSKMSGELIEIGLNNGRSIRGSVGLVKEDLIRMIRIVEQA